MRVSIYTAVFGGYDVVIPPQWNSNEVDYLLFSDRKSWLYDRGWVTAGDCSPSGLSPILKNRFHKFFPNLVIKNYDVGIYVDGNIRVIDNIAPLVNEFVRSGAPIGLFRHPYRASVYEEAEACVRFGKIRGPSIPVLEQQVSAYRAAGLPDDHRLTENQVILTRPADPRLPAAMSLWWREITTHSARDQVSLPYVLWKAGLVPLVWDWCPRHPNPYFLLRGQHPLPNPISRLEAYVRDRADDGLLLKSLHRVAAKPLNLSSRVASRILRRFSN